jgi:hypothetical protein
MIDELAKLHPVAQVIAIIAIAVVIGVFIWQFFKTAREM